MQVLLQDFRSFLSRNPVKVWECRIILGSAVPPNRTNLKGAWLHILTIVTASILFILRTSTIISTFIAIIVTRITVIIAMTSL